MEVAFVHNGYPEHRNFASAELEGIEFRRRRDVIRIPEHLYYRVRGKTPLYLHNLHLISTGPPLVHFFNGLNIGTTPWISSFETLLPRLGSGAPWDGSSLDSWGLRLLANKRCRRLIAISESAANIQRMKMSEFGLLGEKILSKMQVLHPPQALIQDKPKAGVNSHEPIKCVFVGADFFRKGGLEVLQVFDSLLTDGAKISLTIVSSMNTADYATRSTPSERVLAKQLIAKWPMQIAHFDRLSNSKVLDLMKDSHVGLLPTWADTYGYSVLEAQAAGCPVVTTDIRALPEINNDKVGWVIPVPKNFLGNGLVGSAQERELFRRELLLGLQSVLNEIVENRAAIAQKSEAALARIRSKHDPQQHAERLSDVYRGALSID